MDLLAPQDANLTPEQLKVLKIFERTFLCYIIEDPAAQVRACVVRGAATIPHHDIWLYTVWCPSKVCPSLPPSTRRIEQQMLSHRWPSLVQALRERLNTLESELSESRNLLALGYKDPKVYTQVWGWCEPAGPVVPGLVCEISASLVHTL